MKFQIAVTPMAKITETWRHKAVFSPAFILLKKEKDIRLIAKPTRVAKIKNMISFFISFVSGFLNAQYLLPAYLIHTATKKENAFAKISGIKNRKTLKNPISARSAKLPVIICLTPCPANFSSPKIFIYCVILTYQVSP